MLENIKTPPSGDFRYPRSLWICFAIFFAASLGYELYRLFRGVGEIRQIAFIASMLFMVIYRLVRRPTVRVSVYLAWVGLLFITLVLMTLQFLHFVHII